MMSSVRPSEDQHQAAARRRSANLAGPYALATIIGAIAVFLSVDLWWVPVLTMFIYLGFGLGDARRNGMTLEFSDSFYYLGFTLTIASLLASLQPFRGIAPESGNILRHFGLGLFTTLIGVVGRTVLQMFYRTPSENIEATNQQIVVAATEYLQTLEKANDRSEQILRGTLDGLDTALREELAELRTTLRGVNAAVKREATKITNFHIDPSTLQQALAACGEAIEAGGERFSEALRRLETIQAAALGLATRRTEDLGATIQSVDEVWRSVAGNLEDLRGEIARLEGRLAAVTLDVTPTQQALEAFARNIEQVAAGLHETSHRLAEAVAAVTRGAAGIGSRIATITHEPLRTIEATMRQAGEDLAEMNRVLEDIVRAAQASVTRVDDAQA